MQYTMPGGRNGIHRYGGGGRLIFGLWRTNSRPPPCPLSQLTCPLVTSDLIGLHLAEQAAQLAEAGRRVGRVAQQAGRHAERLVQRRRQLAAAVRQAEQGGRLARAVRVLPIPRALRRTRG